METWIRGALDATEQAQVPQHDALVPKTHSPETFLVIQEFLQMWNDEFGFTDKDGDQTVTGRLRRPSPARLNSMTIGQLTSSSPFFTELS